MHWFKHYVTASTSIKINQIIDDLGLEGYARYFLLLELLASKYDGTSTVTTVHFSEISAKVRIKFGKKLETFLQKLSNFCLIEYKVTGKVYEIDCPILADLQSRDFKRARSKRDPNPPKIKIKDKDKIERRERVSSPDNGIKIDALIQLFNDTLAQGKIKHAPFFVSNESLENFTTLCGFKDFDNLEKWRLYFTQVSNSDFLTGKTGKFFVTLPWLLKPENAEKVLAGQYQNGGEVERSSLEHLRPEGD